MTGPEAYSAAAELLEQALTVATHPDEIRSLIAAAQVYATLAVASAAGTS